MYRDVAQFGDVRDRCRWQMKGALRSGSNPTIGKQTAFALTESRLQQEDVRDRCRWQMKGALRSGSNPTIGKQTVFAPTESRLQQEVRRITHLLKILYDIEMWLSLVERHVRVSITVLCVVNSKNAENP